MSTIEQQAGEFLKTLQPVLVDYQVREYNITPFIKSAMIAISQNDKLAECLKSPEGKASLNNAMRMAAGTGLSLNPQGGCAALVPFNKKVNDKWVTTAQYMVMKNGLIELALESGKVQFITADTVRENDEFDMSKTMNGDEYKFKPARKNRGDIDGFFAAVKMNDGTCHCRYMAVDEVNAHREQFSAKSSMPEQGYGEKTVLKKLLNGLHISQELDNAIGAEAHREEVDITPAREKGTSADELSAKVAEVVEAEKVEEAEVIVDEEPKKPSRKPVI